MGDQFPGEQPLRDPRYRFSNGWFDPFIPVWDRILEERSPSRILEIGSYEGKSACYLIERVGVERVLEIHCVDTWEGSIENQKELTPEIESRFDANLAVAISRCHHTPNVYKHRCPSYLALSHLLATGHEVHFDLVYVDGSHQAPDVLSDAILGFHLTRVGGLLIFDDYLWHMEPHGREDPLNMPKVAIDAFLNLFQRKVRIIPSLPLVQVYALKTSR